MGAPPRPVRVAPHKNDWPDAQEKVVCRRGRVLAAVHPGTRARQQGRGLYAVLAYRGAVEVPSIALIPIP